MDRGDLLSILKLAKPCLASNDVIPEYKNFCFTEGCLTATNSFQAIAIDTETEFEGLVNGDLLTKLLDSYSTGEVEFEVNENNLFVKATLRNRANVPLQETDNFKFLLEHSDNMLDVSEDFVLGLKKCLLSVSKDGMLPINRGVLLLGGVMLSSDRGSRISYYDLDEEWSVGDGVLLPKVFCEMLIAMVDKFGGFKMAIEESFVVAEWPNATLFSYLDKIPKIPPLRELCNAMLKSEVDPIFVNKTVLLSGIVKRHLLFKGFYGRISRLNVDDEGIEVVTDSDGGKVKDKIEVDFSGTMPEDGISAVVELELLKDCLPIIDRFTFNETEFKEIGSKAVFIGSDDSGKFYHFITSL